MKEEILDQPPVEESRLSRKQLLPVWILGVLIPVAIVFGALGYTFSLSIYGLETISPFSTDGLIIMAFLSFKGLVAFGLITKKDWAVDLAIIDGAIGILFCGFMMLVYPFLMSNGPRLIIRLELIALIPYFLKMKSIRSNWLEGGKAE